MRTETGTDASAGVRRVLSRAYSRLSLSYLAVGVLLVVAIAIGGHEVEHHINAIDSWITELGPWGQLAFIGLFILGTSFLVPDTVLCIVAGALFGLHRGAAGRANGSDHAFGAKNHHISPGTRV